MVEWQRLTIKDMPPPKVMITIAQVKTIQGYVTVEDDKGIRWNKYFEPRLVRMAVG
jgi:hypothetical protein